MYVKLKVAGYKPDKAFDADLDEIEKLIRESKIDLENSVEGASEKFEIFELESVDRVEEYVHTNKNGGIGTTINIWLIDGSVIGPFKISAQEFLTVSSNMLSSVQDFQFFRGTIRKI